jgi:hypothetical protein
MAEDRQVDERPFRVGARFPDFATFVRALKNYQKGKERDILRAAFEDCGCGL